MKGRTPKDPERRQRRRKGGGGHGLHVWTNKVPDPPGALPGWLKVTIKAWETYWKSPQSKVIDRDVDLPAVYRLFALRDESERSMRAYRKSRFIEGSKGQPILNPLARTIPQLDAEIRHLEDRLGMNPVSRRRIGPAKSTPKLHELISEASDDDASRNDPRNDAADG